MSVFISYRRDDARPAAGRLYETLCAHLSATQVSGGVDTVPPGRDFREEVVQTINDSSIMVVVLGPDWLGVDIDGGQGVRSSSDFVRMEVAQALSADVRIFPVFVDGATMPAAVDLPSDLVGLTFLNPWVLDHDSWDRDVAALIAAIAEGVARAQKTTADTDVARETWRAALTEVLERPHGIPLFWVEPNIPVRKLRNATAHCQIPDGERAMALFDCTPFGSANRGLIAGASGVYFYNANGPNPGRHAVDYSLFPWLNFEESDDGVFIGNIVFAINVSRRQQVSRLLSEIRSIVIAAGYRDVSPTGVPAGWYPDPSGRFELRYWHADAWSEHVSMDGQPYIDTTVA